MDKRRKTLDRWQRLGFGRRSGSNPRADSPTHSSEQNKSSEKTERLKELTEKLKGTRTSQNPPVPPPRKPRSPNPITSTAGSTASLAEAIPSGSNSQSTSPGGHHHPSPSTPFSETRGVFHDSLKAISNSFRSSHQDVHSVDDDYSAAHLPTSIQHDDEKDQFNALPKIDSTRLHSLPPNSHKTIPCRSASFSQVDYSSGKYIRSALGALKASIMKHKEPTVVENANLTLPRKKDSTSSNPSSEDLTLRTDNADNSDKYIFLTDNRDRNSMPQLIDQQSTYLAPTIEPEVKPLVIVNASEMTLDTLCEEELHLQQTTEQDEYLQTATTCLIPVPVYECVVRDFNFSEESDSQWIAANEEDGQLIEVNATQNTMESEKPVFFLSNESVEEPQPVSVGEIKSESPIYDVPSEIMCPANSYCCEDPTTLDSVYHKEVSAYDGERNKFERSNTWSHCGDAEHVPEISVTPGSTFELEGANASEETHDDQVQARPNHEFVEVRKRHSNEDKFDKLVNSSQTSLDSFNTNPSEDRRKIDKSKRRKGMYIQWPVLDKQKSFDSVDWSSPNVLPVSTLWQCDAKQPLITNASQPEPSAGFLSSTNSIFLMCKSPETPLSETFEATTPESEYGGGRPVWPRVERRQSLTGQSSEEKEDPATISASPSIKSFNKLNYLRSDSISDNESERQMRERCSQSPAPNEQDLKRYSKRPLRGPYGQMLEAEMNKPAKPLYSEILEELNKSDRFYI